MDIANSLLNQLQRDNIAFQTHFHRAESSLSALCEQLGIDPRQVAVPILLRSKKQAYLMAVVPLSYNLDRSRLTAMLRRDFDYLYEDDWENWFLDCESGAEPPLPQPYNLPCIIERSLLMRPRLFMRGGNHRSLISLTQEQAKKLYSNYPKAVIANPSAEEGLQLINRLDKNPNRDTSINAILNELDRLQRIPPMPALAMKLIQQTADPDTSASDLAETIELDPSVTAQVLRYASSPYFGYAGKLDSVQAAITRVLGFELVSHIALGIASCKAFSVPREGVLGLKAFWKHGLYSAVMCQSLARRINQPSELNPATAYLCGLLHNFGVLLMGHLYPSQFKQLSHLLEQRKTISLHELEQELISKGDAQSFFNIGHEFIGGYLLEKWCLPEEVVACAYHHHDQSFADQCSNYVHLVQISNRLLSERGIGDLFQQSQAGMTPSSELISIASAETVFQEVMDMCSEIDNLADHMAA